MVTAGAFAIAGSALAAAVAHRALFAGGIFSGLIGCYAGASIARYLHWIPASATKLTALGAGIGFVAAAAIALNTLHNPIGPILSSFLVGIGGLLGLGSVSKNNKNG